MGSLSLIFVNLKPVIGRPRTVLAEVYGAAGVAENEHALLSVVLAGQKALAFKVYLGVYSHLVSVYYKQISAIGEDKDLPWKALDCMDSQAPDTWPKWTS